MDEVVGGGVADGIHEAAVPLKANVAPIVEQVHPPVLFHEGVVNEGHPRLTEHSLQGILPSGQGGSVLLGAPHEVLHGVPHRAAKAAAGVCTRVHGLGSVDELVDDGHGLDRLEIRFHA